MTDRVFGVVTTPGHGGLLTVPEDEFAIDVPLTTYVARWRIDHGGAHQHSRLFCHRRSLETIGVLQRCPDAPMYATGSFDGAIKIWDAKAWAEGGMEDAMAGTCIEAHVIDVVAFEPGSKGSRLVTMHRDVNHYSIGSGRSAMPLATKVATVTVWRVAGGQMVKDGERTGCFSDVVWTAPDRLLVVGKDVEGRNGEIMDDVPPDALPPVTVQCWGGSTLDILTPPTVLVEATGVIVTAAHGQAVAFGMKDGRMVVHDVDADGKIQFPARWQTQAARSRVSAAAWSPDGAFIAVPYRESYVHLLDAATGSVVTTLGGPPGVVRMLAFSSSGERVWMSNEYAIMCVPLAPSESREAVDVHRLVQVHAIANCGVALFASHVAVGDLGGNVHVYDLESTSHEAVASMHVPTYASVRCVCFSPDGQSLLIGCLGGECWAWDWTEALGRGGSLRPDADPTVRPVYETEDGSVTTIQWSPDGTVAIGTTRGQLVLVPPAPRAPLVVQAHANNMEIWSVVFSPDGRHVATSSEDQTTGVWTTGCDGTPPTRVQSLGGHTAAVTCNDWNGEWLITSSDDRTLMLWKTDTWTLEHTFRTQDLFVTYCALTESELFCVTEDGFRYSFALHGDRKETSRHKIHCGSIEGLAVARSPCGQATTVATCSSDCTVRTERQPVIAAALAK